MTATFTVHITRTSDGRDDTVRFTGKATAEAYAAHARKTVNPGFTVTVTDDTQAEAAAEYGRLARSL